MSTAARLRKILRVFKTFSGRTQSLSAQHQVMWDKVNELKEETRGENVPTVEIWAWPTCVQVSDMNLTNIREHFDAALNGAFLDRDQPVAVVHSEHSLQQLDEDWLPCLRRTQGRQWDGTAFCVQHWHACVCSRTHSHTHTLTQRQRQREGFSFSQKAHSQEAGEISHHPLHPAGHCVAQLRSFSQHTELTTNTWNIFPKREACSEGYKEPVNNRSRGIKHRHSWTHLNKMDNKSWLAGYHLAYCHCDTSFDQKQINWKV